MTRSTLSPRLLLDEDGAPYRTRAGRLVHAIQGAAPDDDGGDKGGVGGGEGDDAGKGDDGKGGDQWKPKEKGPETAEQTIARLTRERDQAVAGNSKARVTAKEQAAQEATLQAIKALAKSAGIELPGDTPSVEDLQAALTGEKRAANEARVELAVYKAAHAEGVDPDRLLDRYSFRQTIATLEHTDEPGLKKAIGDAVQSDASLRGDRESQGRGSVYRTSGSGEERDAAKTAAPGEARVAAAYAEQQATRR